MRDFDFWWRLMRPHTLSASIIPVIIGSIYGATIQGHMHLGLFFAMLLASILIQIATNLFNEYYDFVRGLDTKESIGISGTIVRDGATPRFVMTCALICYAGALLLGVYICTLTSWWLAFIGAMLMILGYLYTGGPWPISATPLGELFAGGAMGCGIILIAYFLQAGNITWAAWIISLPIAILIGLILTSNSLRDRVGDQLSGRKTLVILLGHKNSVTFMALMFVLCYAWPFLLILGFAHSPFMLLPLLSLPKALVAFRRFAPEGQSPLEMMPAMQATSKTNMYYGLLYALALWLEYIW